MVATVGAEPSIRVTASHWLCHRFSPSARSVVTFQEKSAVTITSILVVVFGAYFALVLGPVAASP